MADKKYCPLMSYRNPVTDDNGIDRTWHPKPCMGSNCELWVNLDGLEGCCFSAILRGLFDATGIGLNLTTKQEDK